MTTPAIDGPFVIVINASSGKHDVDDTRTLIARVLDENARSHEFFLIEDPANIADVAQRAVARRRRYWAWWSPSAATAP